MTTPKIFISSTSVDLADVRAKLREWITGLFDTELIVMETFGSDTAPPEISSVRRVRECDLFVGIYAHRYGTIDGQSGKSITELELDEATAALSGGTLQEILLYIVKEDAFYLSEYKEKEVSAIAGLKRLKERAEQHTYTHFSEKDNLVFYVTRDLFKRLSQLMEQTLKIRKSVLQPAKTLHQPIGMEYLSVDYRNYLFGRTNDIANIIRLLMDNSIGTALRRIGHRQNIVIHAGLIPALMVKKYRVVYARPLGLPSTDINRQLLATVFEGRPFYKGPLLPLLGEISGAIKEKEFLLIIDQFEDILLSRDCVEVDNLLSDLRNFKTVNPTSVKILLCYRSDLEGRLGIYWQGISGSALGLPRFYLKGIEIQHAWDSLENGSLFFRNEIRTQSRRKRTNQK